MSQPIQQQAAPFLQTARQLSRPLPQTLTQQTVQQKVTPLFGTLQQQVAPFLQTAHQLSTPLLQTLKQQTVQRKVTPLFETLEQQVAPFLQTAHQLSTPLLQTLPLECPFAWRTESYSTYKEIKFVPSGADLTFSFTARRNLKIWGYIPIIGTVIGVYRMYKAFLEYRLFSNTHLHHLSHRSINWIIRGAIELFPMIGGIVCMIADIIATHLSSNAPNTLILPDATPCGYCHTCPNNCKC